MRLPMRLRRRLLAAWGVATRLGRPTWALSAALALSWAALCADAVAGQGLAAVDSPAPLALALIAPGVYLHQGPVAEWAEAARDDVANLGVVVGEHCVAVIDSGGSPAMGQRLRAALRRLTPLPVCHVITTHAHPDHLFGRAAFRGSGPDGADPAFVVHARFDAALAARAPRFLTRLQQQIDPAATADALLLPASTPVADQRRIDLGGRSLLIQAWPTAHTDNDLSVLDEATGTAFLGDLWFVGHLPVVDGSLRGWVSAMDRLAAQGLRLAVPGHGAPSSAWPAAASAQQAYLRRLLAETRAALKRGWTLRQTVEAIALTEPGWQLGEAFHRRNVTAAYAELEWED